MNESVLREIGISDFIQFQYMLGSYKYHFF